MQIKNNMKTEIRVNSNGFEVWYKGLGKRKLNYHKTYKTWEEALKETITLKGLGRFIADLKK